MRRKKNENDKLSEELSFKVNFFFGDSRIYLEEIKTFKSPVNKEI